MGSFAFTRTGDTTAKVITILRARRTFRAVREVTPAQRLVDAARA